MYEMVTANAYLADVGASPETTQRVVADALALVIFFLLTNPLINF